ncbi:carbohydrate binding domain-containing protein [Limosilactobacillus reuteri]|uniref:carbohydrate binding domain-containing protein n=1 Tax=Limosilactobacillus reuteri TaxID=1598 RepID=UPI00177D7D12|nr:carbohydrate binding domain-containing protein [Limosilactobacillus reuteri]
MEKTIKYLENGEYHYATVRSVGDLAQLKTTSKETLVEAINELWNGGGNVDPSKVPKPEGYDKLVQDVAGAVKNQQEISQQWIEWKKEEAQLTEERKQAYLQAMKEMQEAIDKAKADAAALDDKTAKLDEQITKTFSELDTNIQNMHEQLQKEADRMNQELINTKSDLTKVRTDLQNAQLDNGKIHDELTDINGKFEHKVWQTDLDPLKEQIDRAETSVQQTKDELLGKASRQDLDTVSNTVSKLDTQLKETAKGVEISVKKDELGGEIAEALTNKTNILLGTRRFTTNKWTQRDHVEICSDPWKGFLVAKQNSPIEGIQQSYDVKAGTTYIFSLFAKMDNLDGSNKPQITLAQNNLDTSLDTKIDVWRKAIDDITSDFKRYNLTFTPSEDCTIYPHVISNSNNPIFVCGYQLEIGKELTPWEPNQEDVGDYVEKSEAQFNVYNDKIQALTEKQRQQGDTQEKLRTEVTQTAEGVKQVSESLKDTNGDITNLRGDLERTADHMKSEYESYTNKAVGQISDSTLNLIKNSSFQNKDEDFAQWQNVSAKANVRQDENGLRWVELTQSGLTTDNPQGLTSNYFNVKQGKVTVAVDIKSGDKATLDNESVLFLELYNDAKKRVDFRFVTLSELGLSKNLLDDHKVHRGLYRLGIDRNDAKYMTVKAHLMRNGDLYFTNFSARLSSIDDGAYEPNPDDINQQILKQNTKIEQNAKEVAIKANSVDVTRDIKSAVDGIQVGGTNLIKNSGIDIVVESKTTDPWPAWCNKAIYWDLTPGETYTFSVSATNTNGVKEASIRIWNSTVNKEAPGNLVFPADGRRHSTTFTIPKDGVSYSVWLYAGHMGKIEGKNFTTTYHHPQLELGNKSTSWSPAPEDTSAEIKSAKDAAIQVASDQINIHVNELSTSFDDKLNKRVNEVKTASEKFTSDGIEQVVTKVTNVKNDVDRLGDKIDGIQIGGRNLLVGTSDDEKSGKAYAFADYQISGGLQPGKTYTLSGWARVDQNSLNHRQNVFIDAYSEDWSWSVSLGINASVDWQYNKLTFTTPVGKQLHPYVTVYLSHPDGGTNENNNDAISGMAFIKKLKLEEGNISTDYTHAPEDINQSIKDATEYKTVTGTIDFNNLKTQQKIFYKDLQATNAPAGGNYWYYLDVEPGYDGRILQTAISDRDNITWVRTFVDNWGPWIRQADQRNVDDLNNQINGFKTETTASVKNLGDRVTTEVNSVTTKINGLQSGGQNLIQDSDANAEYATPWDNTTFDKHACYYNGTRRMFVISNARKDELTSGCPEWFPVQAGKQYTLSFQGFMSENVSSYDVWLLGRQAGTTGIYTKTEILVNDERLSPSKCLKVTRTFTVPSDWENFEAYIRFDNNGSTDGKNSVFFFNEISLKEGNLDTGYSPSPADTADQIKKLNTKLDVANGQIQGKVTETQVNDILNGKGYATQSWAQTMFQMKSDSITLQAVRDNITNGIQDQVNGINNKIDTQTLDSADINNMRTQGHYFVRNLANSPISGWVYVDITGNNNDRLKQDVYQDSGYEHKSRRWFGDSWTEWTTDVNNKNVVSQINITPDNIKIASKKITIDGDTDIQGTLNVPEVRLRGKSGMIGLDGNKGIIISSADTLFQTRVTKLGMDFLTTTNGQKEIMGGITTGFSTNNGNLNGISIVLDTQQKLGYPYGGDFFSIGNTTSIANDDNRSWNRAMDYDASGQLHEGGFMWYEKSYLTGEGQNIYVGGVRGNGNSAYDPLMIGTAKFSASVQPDKYQPIISLGYAGGNVSKAGIGFLWDQMKPYGSWDITDVGDIWYDGQKFRFGWYTHPRMMDNSKVPCMVRLDDKGGVVSGFGFAFGSAWAIGTWVSNITAALTADRGW